MDNKHSLRQLVTSLPFIGTSLVIGFIIILILLPNKKKISYEKNETVKQPWDNTIADSNVDFSRIIFRAIEDELKELNDKLDSESLITKQDLASCRTSWNDYLEYNISIKIKSKDIPEKDMLNFIKGGDMSGDNLKKINPDDLEYLVSLQVLNSKMLNKISDVESRFDKLCLKKISNYKKVVGDEKFNQLKQDIGAGKYTTEQAWEIVKNPDNPKQNPEN